MDEPFNPENAKFFIMDYLGDEHVEPVEPMAFQIRDPIKLSLSKP